LTGERPGRLPFPSRTKGSGGMDKTKIMVVEDETECLSR
jgi:hypothetical protein